MSDELMKDIPVNDGKGFFDSEGLIDTLIVDLNNLTKALISGEFVQYSALVLQMYQKLKRLKTGVKRDRESLEEQVKDLKRHTNELAEKAFRNGGAENGPTGDPKEE